MQSPVHQVLDVRDQLPHDPGDKGKKGKKGKGKGKSKSVPNFIDEVAGQSGFPDAVMHLVDAAGQEEAQLVVCGCTRGKHRSPVVAQVGSRESGREAGRRSNPDSCFILQPGGFKLNLRALGGPTLRSDS